MILFIYVYIELTANWDKMCTAIMKQNYLVTCSLFTNLMLLYVQAVFHNATNISNSYKYVNQAMR